MKPCLICSFALLLLASCPPGKTTEGTTPQVLPKTSLIALPSTEVLQQDEPRTYFVGADDTIAIDQPGSYASILRVTPTGQTSTKLATLPPNSPLQFVGQERGPLQATSFDDRVSYAINPNAKPGPWTDLESIDEDELWHTTMWRADASQLSAGLLRVVAARHGQWSLVDFHVPGIAKPRWRVNLPAGTTCQAAAMLPGATHFALLLVDSNHEGQSTLQLRRTSDAEVVWSTQLESPVSGWTDLDRPLAHSPDGKLLAVVVEARKRCQLCSDLWIIDAAKGSPVRKIEIPGVVSSDFLHVGLTEHTVWLFQFIPFRRNHQFERPTSCQYLSFSLATGKQRPAPAPEWGFASCKLWGLAPLPTRSGVVGLGWQDQQLLVLRADEAP